MKPDASAAEQRAPQKTVGVYEPPPRAPSWKRALLIALVIGVASAATWIIMV